MKDKNETASARQQWREKLELLAKSIVGPEPLSVDDVELLTAGKRLIDATPYVFAVAKEDVLCVVDLRDAVAATWFAVSVGIDPSEADSLVEWIISRTHQVIDGAPGLVTAFWFPRVLAPGVLKLAGFDVPKNWSAMLDVEAPPGAIHTILKRDGRGLLAAIDFTHLPPMPGASVKVSFSDRDSGDPS